MKGRHWLLAASSLLATLALAELALRALDLPRRPSPPSFVGATGQQLGLREDPACFWRLTRGNGKWRVDDAGLRGDPPPIGHPAPDTLRIVCAGDSCTFGVGVTYDQTYGAVLEHTLQAELPGGRVETVLCATPAFSSQQTRALYELEGLPRHPHITIVYCGAWNDYQPPIGSQTTTAAEPSASAHPSDRELAERLNATRDTATLRLFELARSSTDTRSSESPAAQRVPIADFVENLRAIAEGARGIDSAVVFVVPPVRDDTQYDWPIAAEYQRAVRELAANLDCLLVDGQALFEACAQRVGSAWLPHAIDDSPLFRDGAHPTPFGHRLLADALRETLLAAAARADAAPGFDRLRKLAASPRHTSDVHVDRCEPDTVRALRSTEIRVFGRGFETVRGARLGELRALDLSVVSAAELRFDVPEHAATGDVDLTLITEHGLVGTGVTIHIAGPELRVTENPRADATAAPTLTIEVVDRAGRAAGCYVAGELLPAAAATLFGPFELQSAGAGRPASDPSFPYRWPPLADHGLLDANGVWRTTIALPTELATRDHVFVQAIVFMSIDPEAQKPQGPLGALTAPVRVELSQRR